MHSPGCGEAIDAAPSALMAGSAGKGKYFLRIDNKAVEYFVNWIAIFHSFCEVVFLSAARGRAQWNFGERILRRKKRKGAYSSLMAELFCLVGRWSVRPNFSISQRFNYFFLLNCDPTKSHRWDLGTVRTIFNFLKALKSWPNEISKSRISNTIPGKIEITFICIHLHWLVERDGESRAYLFAYLLIGDLSFKNC